VDRDSWEDSAVSTGTMPPLRWGRIVVGKFCEKENVCGLVILDGGTFPGSPLFFFFWLLLWSFKYVST